MTGIWIARVLKGGYKRGYQRLYVVTCGNKELYEVTVGYRGIKVVVTKVTLVTKITLVTIVS